MAKKTMSTKLTKAELVFNEDGTITVIEHLKEDILENNSIVMCQVALGNQMKDCTSDENLCTTLWNPSSSEPAREECFQGL